MINHFDIVQNNRPFWFWYFDWDFLPDKFFIFLRISTSRVLIICLAGGTLISIVNCLNDPWMILERSSSSPQRKWKKITWSRIIERQKKFVERRITENSSCWTGEIQRSPDQTEYIKTFVTTFYFHRKNLREQGKNCKINFLQKGFWQIIVSHGSSK